MQGAPKNRIHVKTFGCQMNVYDSDRMSGLLVEKGFQTEPDLRQADVILINTCSIRDKSEHKVLTLLGQLKPLKDQHPDRVIAVAGCVGQRMGRTLLQKVPHLDLVLGPDQVDDIAGLVEEVRASGRRVVKAKLDDAGRGYSQPAVIHQAKPCEFLTIMKGCDHFCTYCIVPFVRGREKSRALREVIDDTRRLVVRGTRQVTYLGQNINTYGKGTPERLSALIEHANEVEGLERIRYVTSHPRDLGDDLIQQFETIEKLCPALHLPFQSGSDAVLKRMSRLYTQSEYLRKVEGLRRARPDIALSTDVIVGFPGETDADFLETIRVLETVRFSGTFFFKYSPRPGTRAFEYGDEVSEAVKEERLARVEAISNAYTMAENEALVGQVTSVLVESMDKKNRHFSGRNEHNKMVHVFNIGQACVGNVIDVETTEANGSNLSGYYVGAPRIRTSQTLSAPVSIAAH